MQARQQYVSIGISYCSLTGKIPSSKSMFSRRLLSQFFFWGLQGKAILSSPVPSDTYNGSMQKEQEHQQRFYFYSVWSQKEQERESMCSSSDSRSKETKTKKTKKIERKTEGNDSLIHEQPSSPFPHPRPQNECS